MNTINDALQLWFRINYVWSIFDEVLAAEAC